MHTGDNNFNYMRTSAICLREVDFLFTPFRARKFQSATRLAMAPLPRFLAMNGVPTPEMLRYYRRRAENMLGLVITEPSAVADQAAAADSGMACFYGGSALRAWKGIRNAVHAAQCRIIPLLNHAGLLRHEHGDIPHPEAPPIGPSGIAPDTLKKRGETMSRSRIEAVVAAYAESARYARALHFDGVAIDGAHGGLVEQFLRSDTNLRMDEYGGTLAGRARFAIRVVHAVRKVAGRHFPVVFHLSHADSRQRPLVNTPAELETLLQALRDAGVDMFSCDGLGKSAFHGSPLDFPAWIRLLAHCPVIAHGGIGLRGMEMERLMQRLRAGDFDMLALGRALLADAEWGSKIRNGRQDEIIPYTPKAWLHLY